jgi:hypothetical protein
VHWVVRHSAVADLRRAESSAERITRESGRGGADARPGLAQTKRNVIQQINPAVVVAVAGRNAELYAAGQFEFAAVRPATARSIVPTHKESVRALAPPVQTSVKHAIAMVPRGHIAVT